MVSAAAPGPLCGEVYCKGNRYLWVVGPQHYIAWRKHLKDKGSHSYSGISFFPKGMGEVTGGGGDMGRCRYHGTFFLLLAIAVGRASSPRFPFAYPKRADEDFIYMQESSSSSSSRKVNRDDTTLAPIGSLPPNTIYLSMVGRVIRRAWATDGASGMALWLLSWAVRCRVHAVRFRNLASF